MESSNAKHLPDTVNENMSYVTSYWRPEYKCKMDQDLLRDEDIWYFSSSIIKWISQIH